MGPWAKCDLLPAFVQALSQEWFHIFKWPGKKKETVL